jgi:hypothetical protein
MLVKYIFAENMCLVLINIVLDEIQIWPVVHEIGPTQAQGRFSVDCTVQPTFNPEVSVHGNDQSVKPTVNSN